MARDPYHNPPSQTWTEDSATVIFGDELLEDVPPQARAHPRSVPPPSVPPAARAAVRSPSSRSPSSRSPSSRSPSSRVASAPTQQVRTTVAPDSGLDSLRPYVGSQPALSQPKREPVIEVDLAPEPSQPAGGGLRGFLWGSGLTLVVGVGVFAFFQGGDESSAEVASAPQVLDGDAIAPIPPQALLTRATKGEKEAIEQLRKKDPSELTGEEVLALSLGEEAMMGERVRKEVAQLAKKKSLTHQEKENFFAHAGNERTFRVALLEMSKNKAYWGPDLIYEATRRFRFQDDVKDFAMSLLMTPEVYKYASPALTVVIDAETTSECEDVRQLVDRVHEDGDSRAVRHMAKFAETVGCGVHKNEDCYPCLREDRALVDALRAAQGRLPPR